MLCCTYQNLLSKRNILVMILRVYLFPAVIIFHITCFLYIWISPFMFILFGQSTRVSCVLRLWIHYMFVGVQIACFKPNSITPAPFGTKIKSFSILSTAVETRGRVKNSRCSYFALEKNVSLNVKKSRGLKTCSAMVIHFEQQ